MRILGLHIRDTRNAGDRWSSPLDYLDFPGHEVIAGDMRAPPDCTPGAVIYGGGSITASPDFRRWPGITIGWGVGHHERSAPWGAAMAAEHRRAAALCDLYYPRDAVPGLRAVPCASCLHPVFDACAATVPTYPVVRYSASRRIHVAQPADAPHMTNEDGTIHEAVRFLASGAVVITSSYHGAYWAGLLGREVRVLPWGSKFDYLPRLDLAQCRAANHAAHREVLRRLNG